MATGHFFTHSVHINNLITSCFDCNRGKSNIPLNKLPNTIKDNVEILEEKHLQYKEYQKLLRKINKAISNDIQLVEDAYIDCFPEFCLKESFKNSSIKMFIEKIGVSEVVDSMYIACSRVFDEEKAIKYFCGICWNKIRDNENG